MDDKQDDIIVGAVSPVEGDSLEERRALNAAKMAAARERARRTIKNSRARRQAMIEGQLVEYELGQRIRAAVAGPGQSMSVEEALGMLAAFGETKH